MTKDSSYRAEYYINRCTEEIPVKSYIDKLSEKHQRKIFSYINKLIEEQDCLRFPYAEHIKDKIWQLRPLPYRIFYFIFTNKRIILLHIFRKRSQKTPSGELNKALNNYKKFYK